MNPALEQLLASKLENEQIDRFLESNEFPLVDDDGATFVYRGNAQEVHLQHWIHGLPSSQAFQRVEGTDLWHLYLELPESSRIEYKLNVVSNGTAAWIEDPLNPRRAHDPFGSNSVCWAHGYDRAEWTFHDPSSRPGRLEELRVASRFLGSDRTIRIYLPARYRRTRRYPLLIVHDGEDYLRYADLKTVLDNLIHRLEIPSMIVALTQSSDRLLEYAAHIPHARFLTEELVPLLERHLPLLSDPASRCLMGASFGAVASLHAAWERPGFYGRLLLQSGSFAFTDIGHHQRGEAFDPVVRFVNRFRGEPRRASERLFLSCGRYESLIYYNRSLVPLLQEHGMEVRFRESSDGHNWENWRDRLRDGLSWLFPGPLWMVYE